MTTGDKPLWVLGYGSLIFKPPPHAKYVVPGVIHGYARRFWQSSSDHRGTPEKKGRVATLIGYDDIMAHEQIRLDVLSYDTSLAAGFSRRDLKVWGCAYYIPPEHAVEVSEYLDVREQDGYSVHEIPFLLHHDEDAHNEEDEEELLRAIKQLPVDDQTGKRILNSSVYIGTLDNASFIGPELLGDTARVISSSSGPSGDNWEYLELLYRSLAELDKHGQDEYLEQLVKAVLELKEHKLKEHEQIV